MVQKSGNQLRLVVCPIIYRVLAPSQVVDLGICEPSTVCFTVIHLPSQTSKMHRWQVQWKSKVSPWYLRRQVTYICVAWTGGVRFLWHDLINSTAWYSPHENHATCRNMPLARCHHPESIEIVLFNVFNARHKMYTIVLIRLHLCIPNNFKIKHWVIKLTLR